MMTSGISDDTMTPSVLSDNMYVSIYQRYTVGTACRNTLCMSRFFDHQKVAAASRGCSETLFPPPLGPGRIQEGIG